MRRTTRFVLLAIVGTILGVLLDGHAPLGRLLYAPFAGAAQPEGPVVGVLLGGVVAQALGLGLALAMLGDAPALVRGLARVGGSRPLAVASFVALLWLLASWVPHGSLHQHFAPTSFWSLAAIEWIFHVSLVGAAAILVRFAYAAARAPQDAADAQARPAAVVPAAR